MLFAVWRGNAANLLRSRPYLCVSSAEVVEERSCELQKREERAIGGQLHLHPSQLMSGLALNEGSVHTEKAFCVQTHTGELAAHAVQNQHTKRRIRVMRVKFMEMALWLIKPVI